MRKSGRPDLRRRRNMTRISKLLGAAAAALMMVALQAAPASAQFAGGGEDMMTQMAPMLEMMKAKMGKRRFGMLMKTMGPMMGQMTQGGGLGGMSGGLGGGAPRGARPGSGVADGRLHRRGGGLHGAGQSRP